MKSRKLQPNPIIGQEVMDALRKLATEHEPDTIAVIALAGTPERGLGLSASSATDETETFRLLAHALHVEATAQGWIDEEGN